MYEILIFKPQQLHLTHFKTMVRIQIQLTQSQLEAKVGKQLTGKSNIATVDTARHSIDSSLTRKCQYTTKLQS